MHDDEYSMSSVSSEGEAQYADWLAEHICEEHVQLIEGWANAGRITDEQRNLLMREAEAVLMEDPYGIEAFVSPWDNARHTSRVYLVAAYHTSRRYGGAEEGGWWYDHLDPLTDAYAEAHGRAFNIAGPFDNSDDAYDVARDLNACEVQVVAENTGRRLPSSIVWRVQCSVPHTPTRPRYC